jgi:chromate transporter
VSHEPRTPATAPEGAVASSKAVVAGSEAVVAGPASGGASPSISFAEANRVWAGIGLRSFGGPTAQIALMHRVLVDERRWLGEREFLDALGFCMLLPGPEAMQLATYAGWKLHGLAGGLAAGLWFVLPGALVVGSLAAIYAAFGHVPWIVAAFAGIKATVLVLVIEATLRIGRRALTERRQVAVAGASLLSLGLFSVPYPLVVLAAGLLGASWAHATPAGPAPGPVAARGSVLATARTIIAWSAVWTLPLLALAARLGPRHVVPQLSLFFSKLAVVTFGGAYATLGYMSQDVVARHGWLTAGQMLDGLGLAETTPGPLILVTEFVGFVAAWQAPPHASLARGVLGAAVALWATFAPCFLWIFAGAPWLSLLRSQPRLQGAMAAITSAVLGVILSLALWFAVHVLFRDASTVALGPAHLLLPKFSSVVPEMVGLALVSGVLLMRFHWSIHRVIAVAATLSLLLAWLARGH